MNVKHAVNDEKLKDKISEEEKRSILSKISEIEGWLSSNHDAETHEFEAKQKELENIYNPVMQKAYQGASQGGNCGQQYNQGYQQNNAGPSADEVD